MSHVKCNYFWGVDKVVELVVEGCYQRGLPRLVAGPKRGQPCLGFPDLVRLNVRGGANTMVDLPNTMVKLPNNMVDFPNTMVDLPNAM